MGTRVKFYEKVPYITKEGLPVYEENAPDKKRTFGVKNENVDYSEKHLAYVAKDSKISEAPIEFVPWTRRFQSDEYFYVRVDELQPTHLASVSD